MTVLSKCVITMLHISTRICALQRDVDEFEGVTQLLITSADAYYAPHPTVPFWYTVVAGSGSSQKCVPCHKASGILQIVTPQGQQQTEP